MSMSSEGTLAGRTGAALVIGGSGAIGMAVCRRLAEAGSDVALTYRSNADAAAAALAVVEAAGHHGSSHQVATEDDTAVLDLVERVVADHGGIHTLVTAAAPVAWQRWAGTISADTFEDQVAQDFVGFHRLASACLPALRQTAGSIVAVTTVANRRYVLRDVLSSAPKAAIEALVKALAAEEGRHGVRANAVGVGILGEGMSSTLLESGDVREQDMEFALSRIPLGRLGIADDIAGAVTFLAGDTASYITGQWIDVDGGYSI
jgi:NAD(P)-dependent dehydrogenase (short-subunit alcohol dehydrogenase family)